MMKNKQSLFLKNKTTLITLLGFTTLLVGIVAFYFFSPDIIKGKPIYLYLLIAIAAAVVLIGAVFAILIAKGKISHREPDYRSFFIIGISWLPIGIATDNPAFIGMGIVFMVLGLKNKDKWNNQPKWKDLSPAQRKFKIAAMIVLGLAVLAGFVAWYMSAR